MTDTHPKIERARQERMLLRLLNLSAEHDARVRADPVPFIQEVRHRNEIVRVALHDAHLALNGTDQIRWLAPNELPEMVPMEVEMNRRIGRADRIIQAALKQLNGDDHG